MKTAVIFHGWPKSIDEKHFLYRYFLENNYKIIAPYLFDDSFTLTAENVVNIVKKELGGNEPEVIVGISMGGLLVPTLAKKFPTAKLIFIASGPHLKPNSRVFRLGFSFFRSWLGKILFRLIMRLPHGLLSLLFRTVYSLVDPKKRLDFAEENSYEHNLAANLGAFFKISTIKEIEIINFVTSTDNSRIVAEIKNPAIIFSGQSDSLMSVEAGKRLNQLLVNSRLVTTEGGHYQVFSERNLSDLNDFFSNNG